MAATLTFYFLCLKELQMIEAETTRSSLLLQSVFTGKAQEAFTALSVSERVCEGRTNEGHQIGSNWTNRLRFRNWRKSDWQTHAGVAMELTGFFNLWCVAVGVTFEALCDLIVLEHFNKDRFWASGQLF